MDKVNENRKIAIAAERSAKQAQKASEHAQKSTADKAIHAANTALAVYGDVMGAYGKVMGATGALAEKAVVAVFSKLKFMQGLACLPASSQMDPVMGIDVHFVMIPPSPSPVPMPHPYIAMIFDPKDWIACAVMTAKAMVPPPPPNSEGLQLASAVGNMAFSMVMGKLGLGASVKLGAVTPRTISGVKNKTIPHFPMGASFAPVPVLKNSGHAQFGSLFLLADGEPFTGMMHLNNDCWDVGIMQLMRKKASPEAQHLFMPTGFVMAIPSHNVIVNPVPTPINPIAALTKLLNFGIAKLLHKLINKLPGGRLSNALHKAVCHVTGHPVDVVSGMLFTDEEDFSLPGVIPFSWERTWYSDSVYKSPLGHGWYHNYDVAFAIDEKTNQAAYRMNDGRMVGFELPQPGKFSYDRKEKLFLHCHPERNYYYITDSDGLNYHFTDQVYKYEDGNRPYRLLKSISNNNGYSIQFKYSTHGYLEKIIDSANRILLVTNDEKGRITDIIAPHPTNAGQTFVIAHYDYDERGNMICHTDALGQQMKFEYENHLLVKETWRDGMQWYFEFEGKENGARCIHTWGDGNIYNHKLTYLEGCTLVENSLGHVTSYYHQNGLLYNKVDANGAEWGYRYNRFNELEWETDPLGNQQNYSHDDWGNVISSTDPAGGFTSTEYYNPFYPLLPTAAMDAAGGKWKWEYDRHGNLLARVDPLGAKTMYEYEDGLIKKIINAKGAITLLNYDHQQNIGSIVAHDSTITEGVYDGLGNRILTLNANGAKQKIIYDLKNRIEKITDFDDNIISVEYDGIGNIIRYQDNQKEVNYTYNGLWKLTSRKEAGATIIFIYDTEEQLQKIINEEGCAYHFTLDVTGRVIEEISFDDITRKYERNAAGWITKVLRPGGKFTKYSHDNCGRIVEVLYCDTNKETYSYRPDGKIILAVNENATVKFIRNLNGDILTQTVNDEWIQSSYDILGNLVKTTSSLGADIVHNYNIMGDVVEMSSQGWRASINYDKLGLESNRILPGGIASNWQRDRIGRPVTQTVGHFNDALFSILKTKQYQWTVNDLLKQIKDEKGITKFDYDAWTNLSRVIFPNGEEQLRNPDAVGNLYETANRKDRVYANGGQLKKAKGWDYIYDPEGNLIEKRHFDGRLWKYEWDNTGMLIKVIRPDKQTIEFSYDSFGRRLSKKDKNTITTFVWDQNTLLHEYKTYLSTEKKAGDDTEANNSLITWLFDIGNFAPACKITEHAYYSIVVDYLGTPSQMFKEDGSLLWECDLDTYGRVRKENGKPESCPFRYQGQYEDIETGLYYNRFRYYAPEEGIYISKDILGLQSGVYNLYNYVSDTNTIIDCFGLDWNYYLKDKKGKVYYHGRASDKESMADVARRHRGTVGKDGARFGKGDTMVKVTPTGTPYNTVRGVEQRGIAENPLLGRGSDKARGNKINGMSEDKQKTTEGQQRLADADKKRAGNKVSEMPAIDTLNG